jgi:hypothetical protein
VRNFQWVHNNNNNNPKLSAEEASSVRNGKVSNPLLFFNVLAWWFYSQDAGSVIGKWFTNQVEQYTSMNATEINVFWYILTAAMTLDDAIWWWSILSHFQCIHLTEILTIIKPTHYSFHCYTRVLIYPHNSTAVSVWHNSS